MNILYIASVRIPNEKASGLAIMRQCEAFQKNGHTVTLLRPKRRNKITEEPFTYYGMKPLFAVETMNSVNFNERLGLLGFAIARLSQMIASYAYWRRRRNSLNLIYARDPWMLVLFTLFGGGTKMIWEAHQSQDGFFVRLVAKRVHRLVTISNGLRDHFERMTKRKDILVEPSGVNVEQFQNTISQKEARQKYNVPLDAWVIGYIGKYMTMGEEKGVRDLIRAYGKVSKEIPEAHLLIVGPEAHEVDLLKDECRKLHIEDAQVTFLELVQKHFAEYVESADVLVMNYPDTEHFRRYMSPTKLFAYMAGQKLILTSDLPSVREIVDETMALFFSAGEVQSLQVGLLNAFQNGNSFGSVMKERAYHQVMRYSWSARAERILHNI